MPELTLEQQLIVKQAAVRLQRRFDGIFNAETIQRYITDTEEQFVKEAAFTTWGPLLIERLTRDRLRALARIEKGVGAEKPAILFLCVHNAGRSQMAAAWARTLSGGGVEVFSGGSDPGEELNANAVKAMAEVGVDIRSEMPEPWTDEMVRAADVVITMGCGDACPVIPGKRYEDWELTDPAGQPIEVVREVRDEIKGRVEALLTSVGVAPGS
jgi:protein-tyrosine-phosphatase